MSKNPSAATARERARRRAFSFIEKGSVEQTRKVPRHYHAKHRTDGRYHRGRVALWTNTHARIFKDPDPPSTLVPATLHTSIGPRSL